MIEKYRRIFEQQLKELYPEGTTLENVDFQFVDVDSEETSQIYYGLDDAGNLFVKSKEYETIVKFSKTLAEEALDYKNVDKKSLYRSMNKHINAMKALCEYLLNFFSESKCIDVNVINTCLNSKQIKSKKLYETCLYILCHLAIIFPVCSSCSCNKE